MVKNSVYKKLWPLTDVKISTPINEFFKIQTGYLLYAIFSIGLSPLIDVKILFMLNIFDGFGSDFVFIDINQI